MHHFLNVGRHKTLPFSFNLSLLVPTVYLLHHDIYTLTHILRRNRVLSGYSCFARLDGWPNPQYLVVLFSILLPECIVPTTYIRTECEYVDIALGCEKLLLQCSAAQLTQSAVSCKQLYHTKLPVFSSPHYTHSHIEWLLVTLHTSTESEQLNDDFIELHMTTIRQKRLGYEELNKVNKGGVQLSLKLERRLG